ncbi:MAG: DUF2798 domain-containing protein [Gammaproteobacteria bacterium]|nr:DUF2798 domain-containing protein [Gammaproteobacteria bacterium]
MESGQSPSRSVFGLRKLPARYTGIVMPFLLSLLMSGIVSFVSTLHGMGMTHGLLHAWVGAWSWSWMIAFPAVLLVLPIVRALTRLLVETP